MLACSGRQFLQPAMAFAQSPRPDSVFDVPTFEFLIHKTGRPRTKAGFGALKGCHLGYGIVNRTPAGQGNSAAGSAMGASRGSVGQIRSLPHPRGCQQGAGGSWALVGPPTRGEDADGRLCATSSTGPSASATVSSAGPTSRHLRSGRIQSCWSHAVVPCSAPIGFASGRGQILPAGRQQRCCGADFIIL